MSATRIPAFARWSALPIGLVVSAALVWQASYAAFTASTTNPTNNWSTGSVAITSDGTGTAMFNATGLTSTSTGEKCIAVTYNGSLTSTVKLFGTGATTTGTLSSNINLTVQQGTTGSFSGGCTGFTQDAGAPNSFSGTLASFASTYTSSGAGFGTWAPTASGQVRVYKITYAVDASIPNSDQGRTASMGLTWEATS